MTSIIRDTSGYTTRTTTDIQEYVFTIVDAFDRIQLLCFQREIYLSNTTTNKLERFIEFLTFYSLYTG